MSAPDNRRRARNGPDEWPVGLIAAVVLILILDGPIARLADGLPERTRLNASWRAAREDADGPRGDAEVLCFGDSQIKLGILPRLLEARLGRSSHNLAVLGGQPPTSVDLLRRVLGRGHRPLALIVNFSPLLLAMDPMANLDWWAGGIGMKEQVTLAWRGGDPELAIALLLRGGLGATSRRDAIRAALGFGDIDPTGVDERLEAEELIALDRNWTVNRGAQVAPRAFIPIEGSGPGPHRGRAWRWRPHPIHAASVDRFLAMAGERGIPVYWIITPAESGWLARNEGVGTLGRYRDYVRGLSERFGGLTVLDFQRASWGRDLFRDPIHVNRDGAVRLTLAVADAIDRAGDVRAAAGRWIARDGVAPAPTRHWQDLLEDLDQSRLAASRGVDGAITMEGPSR